MQAIDSQLASQDEKILIISINSLSKGNQHTKFRCVNFMLIMFANQLGN
jgi:hypothetical protein